MVFIFEFRQTNIWKLSKTTTVKPSYNVTLFYAKFRITQNLQSTFFFFLFISDKNNLTLVQILDYKH